MDELLDETEVGDFVPYQSGETTRYTLYGGRVSFTAEQYRAVQALLSTSLQSARRDELEKALPYLLKTHTQKGYYQNRIKTLSKGSSEAEGE